MAPPLTISIQQVDIIRNCHSHLDNGDMNKQLTLIEVPGNWRIDNLTKEIGRRGLAKARAALNQRHPASGLLNATFSTSPDSNHPQAA